MTRPTRATFRRAHDDERITERPGKPCAARAAAIWPAFVRTFPYTLLLLDAQGHIVWRNGTDSPACVEIDAASTIEACRTTGAGARSTLRVLGSSALAQSPRSSGDVPPPLSATVIECLSRLRLGAGFMDLYGRFLWKNRALEEGLRAERSTDAGTARLCRTLRIVKRGLVETRSRPLRRYQIVRLESELGSIRLTVWRVDLGAIGVTAELNASPSGEIASVRPDKCSLTG